LAYREELCIRALAGQIEQREHENINISYGVEMQSIVFTCNQNPGPALHKYQPLHGQLPRTYCNSSPHVVQQVEVAEDTETPWWSALQQQHVQERSTRWQADEASPPYAGLARFHQRNFLLDRG
jgi:hypothetical protein